MSHRSLNALFVAIMLLSPLSLAAQDIQADTLVNEPRIAPGEGLPVRTKLTNMQSVRRVDVVLTYQLLDAAGSVMDEESETIAVDTTAIAFHVFALSPTLASGRYTLQVEALYPHQTDPAISSFGFRVEPKLFGLFRSDILFFGALSVALIVLVVVAFALFERRRTFSRIPRDYSHIPERDRVYYEMISDVLMQMRLAVGARALKIASRVAGLKLDKLGRPEQLSGDPAVVMADLVSLFERDTARKVGFAPTSTRGKRAVVR